MIVERSKIMSSKFVMSFLVTVSIMSYQVLGTAVYVENYSFEKPTVTGSTPAKIVGWDNDGKDDIPGWSSDGIAADSGIEDNGTATDGVQNGFLMYSDPAVWQITGETIVEGMTYTLTVDVYTTSGATQCRLSMFYLDGVTKIELAGENYDITDRLFSNPVVAKLRFTAPFGEACIGKNLGIMVDNNGGGWSGLDNVRLDASYVAPIYPEDGYIYVGWEDDLEWVVANDWLCNLYFGTSSELDETDLVLSETTDRTYDPGTLEYETPYYWRVDALEPNVPPLPGYIVHEGSVWSFTTASEKPQQMTISPFPRQIVEPGSNVVFEADGVMVETWTWYKQGNDTPLTNDGTNYLVDANELTVLNMDIDDEGFYYCVGSNSLTSETGRTGSSRLLLRRLFGHWKMNDNLEDSVTDVYPSAVAHPGTMPKPLEPVFVEGIDDSAFDDSADRLTYIIVEDDDPNSLFEIYGTGITASAWIKTTHIGWGAVMSKAEVYTWPDLSGWVMETYHDSISMVMRSGDTSYGTAAGLAVSINDGKWHLVVGTYDPETHLAHMYASYIDEYGVNRLAHGISWEFEALTYVDEPFKIGVESNPSDTVASDYTGLIDDVRLYTYAMDYEEIWEKLYSPVQSEPICANLDYDAEYDLNNDCQTDIDDFVSFIAGWLSGGLY
jgi:hypothetical protein